MPPAAIRIEPIESLPFNQMSYVVWREGSSEAIVVDPGFDPGSILEVLNREALALVAIVNTHGHADHIAGNGWFKKTFPQVPLLIGRNEANLLTDPVANLSAAFGQPMTSPPADRLLDEGERLDIAGLSFLIREIPGHSPGSVVLISEDSQPPIVIGGDVLFAGSVGRTDFPGGSQSQLRDGIHRKLFILPDDTVVYPGHGEPTTIGVEKRSNPFVRLKTATNP